MKISNEGKKYAEVIYSKNVKETIKNKTDKVNEILLKTRRGLLLCLLDVYISK